MQATTDVNIFNIEGYELFSVPRVDKKGGGVAIYVNNNINCSCVKNHCLTVDGIFECITVELSTVTSKQINICCVYRTPGSYIPMFIQTFDEFLTKLKVKKHLFVCGDFNIDLIKQGSHGHTSDFLDMMYSFGLIPLIKKPSRITEFSATCIDNIFTNDITADTLSGIVTNDISDHLPVFTVCNYNVQRSNLKTSITKRQLSDTNITNLHSMLAVQNWDDIVTCLDVNQAYEMFLNKFLLVYNECCPVRQVKLKQIVKQKPWMTRGLINACKKKNSLYRIYLKVRTFQSNQTYKCYKNKLTKILKYAEKQYYGKLFEACKSNIKVTWKNLNNILGRTNTSTKFPEAFSADGNILTDGNDIANGFNNFFVNVGPNLANQIEVTDVSVYDCMNKACTDTMYVTPTTVYEVEKIVNAFKHKKSMDCHDINMSIVKQVFSKIVVPVTSICNKSLMTGIFPSKMKYAKVIPLFKTGENNVFTNYRPVSLLPQFSKILEKLFHNRLDNFVEMNNILTDSQYGFRSNRSTSAALLDLIEGMTDSYDKSFSTIGVFIDLKKAFDTIDHKLLINKLERYGIRGIANKWIESYF